MIKAIGERRSVRKFKDTPVTREQIEALLAAAMMAPSACNSRPWRFVAVTSREVLDKLGECHPHGKMLFKAQAAIVICALADEQAKNEVAKGFYPQDCGAATQNILLQAQEMGLGTCWCGVYPKEHIMPLVSEVLGLPADEIPFNIIAIGEAEVVPSARGFYDGEKVSWVD